MVDEGSGVLAEKPPHVSEQSTTLKDAALRHTDVTALLCVVAFAFIYIAGIVLNGLVYSRVADYYGAAREIATLFGGCTYLAALFIARFRPEWLFVRRISMGFVILCVAMAPLLVFALTTCHPIATVIALCMRSMVRAWAMTLAVASLVRVRSLKLVPLVVALGLLAANCCRPLMPFVDSPAAASVALAIASLVPIVLLTRVAHPVLDRVRTGDPADVMELLHPGAFLKPSHGLFMCVLLFSASSGYAMTFGEVENAPVETGVLAFVLLVIVIYAIAVRGSRQEDLLFSFSVVLTMAGFLMVPLTFDIQSVAANTLMDIGENCFDILLWLMFASIGRRNLFAMLPTFALAEFCSTAGTDIGAMMGHASNGLVHGDERMVISLALILAFVFFAFLWVFFRRFSFSEVLADLDEMAPLDYTGEAADHLGGASLAGDRARSDSRPGHIVDATVSSEGGRRNGDIERLTPGASSRDEMADASICADASGCAGGACDGGAAVRVPDAGMLRTRPSSWDAPAPDATNAVRLAWAATGLQNAAFVDKEGIPQHFAVLNARAKTMMRLKELSDAGGLTEREREIFAMLARGRNARFIMEEFVLSRNTVKSHIKHIYAKLGVHSQQELIDLVESAS